MIMILCCYCYGVTFVNTFNVSWISWQGGWLTNQNQVLSFQVHVPCEPWYSLITHWKTLWCPNPPKLARLSTLLCLTPDDFNRQWGTPRSQWVKCYSYYFQVLYSINFLTTLKQHALLSCMGFKYQAFHILHTHFQVISSKCNKGWVWKVRTL